MKILFFSPHAFTTVHSVPEAIVAEALKERGHEIIMVNCDGALASYCISMSSAKLTPQASTVEKESICKTCRKRRDLILKEFGFRSLMLDNFINHDDELAIQNIIQTLTPERFTELTWMDIPIGRYALYELIIRNKLRSYNLNTAEWEEYKIYLYNTLKSAYAGRKILEEIKPDAVATYNALYSVNHIVCAQAEQHGIPYYTLHAGGHIKWRLSTMTIFKGLMAPALTTRQIAWKQLSNIPISASKVQVVAEHIQELLKATSPWVYSVASNKASPESLKEFFGIEKDKSVLLATMSSADELFAAITIDGTPTFPEPMFPTQIDWIKALIEFVGKRNDVFLIIRVHPREFPNKRDGVLSKQAIELQKFFVDLPGNVRVNWPQDQVSIHDVVKITDVGLNSISTAGLELSMFGVPVVLYDSNQLLAYPPGINYVATNPNDYFQKIDMALKEGWSFENVRKTFRWLSYTFEYVAIDISDGFGKAVKLSIFKKAYNYALRKLIGIRSEDQELIRSLRNRPVPVKNSELLSIAIERGLESHLDLVTPLDEEKSCPDEETLAIKEWVGKLARLIHTEEDLSDDFNRKIRQVLSG